MIIWVQLYGKPAHLKLGGQKTTKIRRDFGQLQIFIANVSGTDGDIENQSIK